MQRLGGPKEHGTRENVGGLEERAGMFPGIIHAEFREVGAWQLLSDSLSWALTPAQLHCLCYFHLSGECCFELLARNSCSPHSQKHMLVLCDKGCLLPVASVYLFNL